MLISSLSFGFFTTSLSRQCFGWVFSTSNRSYNIRAFLSSCFCLLDFMSISTQSLTGCVYFNNFKYISSWIDSAHLYSIDPPSSIEIFFRLSLKRKVYKFLFCRDNWCRRSGLGQLIHQKPGKLMYRNRAWLNLQIAITEKQHFIAIVRDLKLMKHSWCGHIFSNRNLLRHLKISNIYLISGADMAVVMAIWCFSF